MWTLPNAVTLARILLVIPLAWCLSRIGDDGAVWRRSALALAGCMALGDVLDGYLARRLRQESRIGRVLDPLADKVLVTVAVVLLAWAPTSVPGFRLPMWAVAAAIGKDLVLVGGVLAMRLKTREWALRHRLLGKACMAVQCAMIAAILLGPDLPEAYAAWVPGFWWAASVLALVSAADYVWWGMRYTAAWARSTAPGQ